MKSYIPLLLSFLAAGLAYSEVPTLINYQERLLDASNNPVTSTVSIDLNIYDAQTGGNVIYTESIGTVPLVDGVYSFQFGGAGQSVVTTTESIATSDGSTKIYSTTLSNAPIDGSISIADGTYTWSQSAGSSNNSEFSAVVNVATKEVFATYLATAPASGTQIQASYQYQDTSIAGALATGAEHWLELSIDNVAQSNRERLVAVPFAMYARELLLPNSPQIKRTTIRYWGGGVPGQETAWKSNPYRSSHHQLSLPFGSSIIRVEVDLEDRTSNSVYRPIRLYKRGDEDVDLFILSTSGEIGRKRHFFEINEEVDGGNYYIFQCSPHTDSGNFIIHEVTVVWR